MPYSASHAKMIAEVAAIAMKIKEKSRNIVYPLMFSNFVRFEDSGAVKPLFSHPTYIIPQSYRLVKFLAEGLSLICDQSYGIYVTKGET